MDNETLNAEQNKTVSGQVPLSDSERRMRAALVCIGNNLRGGGYDFRPISYEFAAKVADLAFAVADGKPHPQFDASYKATGA